MARTFANSDDSVVVVVGSGAGGGTVSHELSSMGVNVVCLEAGGHINPITTDAAEMFGRITWFDRRIGSGDLPENFPVWSVKGVGGATLHWTASTPRLPEAELRATRYFGDLDDCHVIDWPIGAEELAHYYDKAEQRMGVTGRNGLPMLPENAHFKVLAEGAKRMGLKHARQGNMAINSVPRDGRAACQQLGFCVSGCAVHAKWSSANTPVRKALQSDHFELRTGCHVLRVEHDGNGRASEVVYVDPDGQIQSQKARVVCVAANAVDSARILLNSHSSRFPSGLGNQSGLVGRNYVKHTFSIATAIMPGPVNYHRGTQNLGKIDDFIPSDASRGFAGGVGFEQVSFDPASLSRLSRPNAWGREYASQLRRFDHYAAMLVMGEDPAQPSNRITLHPTEKDQHGMPVPVVHYVDHPNSKAMRRFGEQKAGELFAALGSEEIFFGDPPPATHQMGTCRIADSMDDGVCDPHGRTFDVPNLFVSDGGQFSSSGTSNPTVTIVALAIRQAEHIREQMLQKQL